MSSAWLASMAWETVDADVNEIWNFHPEGSANFLNFLFIPFLHVKMKILLEWMFFCRHYKTKIKYTDIADSEQLHLGLLVHLIS